MEYHCGERAIMNREDMFNCITKQFDGMNREEMETANRCFRELIKPIVEEMKRFYKGFMVGMAQNNQEICEPIQLPRICILVFTSVEEELRKEMLHKMSAFGNEEKTKGEQSMPIEDIIFDFLDEHFTKGQARIKYYNEVRDLVDKKIVPSVLDQDNLQEKIDEYEDNIYDLEGSVEGLKDKLSNVRSILEKVKDKIGEAIEEAD